MSKHNMINPQITFYIRTAKKVGFVQKSKKSILNQKQLKQIAQNKSRIPIQNQILYYNGEEVKQNKNIKLVDKSIVHVVDSRNVGKSKMKLLIKRLPQKSPTEDFQVDSNSSIDEFIKKSISPFYEQPAEKLFFVYSGRQLKREKSFSEQHVEQQTELVCVHAQKDRKKKNVTLQPRSSSNSIKTKDTLQTKAQQTPKKQQKPQQANQLFVQEKLQQTPLEHQTDKTQEKCMSNEKQQQKIKDSQFRSDKAPAANENDEKPSIIEKKLIKSIQQIQCDQIESDQDSDNEVDEGKVNIYHQKLPQDYLMEQTRPRSHTKSDNNNNSGSSSISEPNFKKKKKVSEVQINTHSGIKKEEQSSPKSIILGRNQSESSPQSLQKQEIDKEKVQGENPLTQNQNHQTQQKVKYLTRQQIFENNQNTYSSVIDEPEQSSQPVNLNSGNQNTIGDRDEIFNSYCNRQEEEVYDSQMNYYQVDSSKLEVKCNKGFMTFSNASFLEPSQIHTRQNNTSRHQTNTDSAIKSTEGISQINHRAPQFLGSQIEGHQTLNSHRQYTQQIGGDSLNFSKEQSEMKGTEENEDNLFVDYRRGPTIQQRNNNIMVRQDQVSESNLLSDTYHNPNAAQMMNSITFNLEPNPDEVVSYLKQSEICIVDEEELQEEPNAIAYEKRESQIQTNFRDSANPSQICSNSSNINNPQGNQPQAFESNFGIDPMSLIDGLVQMMEYKISVNAVQSDESDGQDDNSHQNFVAPQSDISYNNQEEQSKPSDDNENDIQASNLLLQEQSNVFVQYQSYRADFESSINQSVKEKNEPHKQNQSNLLEQNSFGITHERSMQSNFLKKTLLNDSQLNLQHHHQNSAIKIVEEDSYDESDQAKNSELKIIEQSAAFINNDQAECSGAFHQISESIHQKVNQASSLIDNLDNNEPQEITFRKDRQSEENRREEPYYESRIDEPQGSKLLYQLSLQAQNQTEQPQLLPGDYIYSTDKVQTPEEVLDSILKSFTHCF